MIQDPIVAMGKKFINCYPVAAWRYHETRGVTPAEAILASGIECSPDQVAELEKIDEALAEAIEKATAGYVAWCKRMTRRP